MVNKVLSNIDTALLNLEHPTNPMMVTGVMFLANPLEYDHLRRTIENRFLRIHRFQQKITYPRMLFRNPRWIDDEQFDLGYHLRRLDLPNPVDESSLQEAINHLASTQLDLTRPPWQFHLVENYNGSSALISRIHHSIADGMALVHTILSLTDTTPDGDPDHPRPYHSTDRNGGQNWALLREARSSFYRTRYRVRGRIERFKENLAFPYVLIERSESTLDAAADIGRLFLIDPDPDTVLKGSLGISKSAAWSDSIPLEQVKTIRKRLGGTVNDVLLTAVTGAIRRYLLDHGEQVDDIRMHAFVPVNLRTPGTEGDLGNRIGALFLSLPVEIADPEQRLYELEDRMNEHKGTMEPHLYFGLLNVLGKTPARIANGIISKFGPRATAVMTNVRGPQKKLYLAGSLIDSLIFWVPQTGRLGIGVSILSYAGEVRVGIITDEGLVPDPQTIIENFGQEFNQLFEQALDAQVTHAIYETSALLDDTIDKLDAIIRDRARADFVDDPEP